MMWFISKIKDFREHSRGAKYKGHPLGSAIRLRGDLGILTQHIDSNLFLFADKICMVITHII